MNLFQILWDAFALDKRNVNELIEISALIDSEKSNNGYLSDLSDDLSIIASTIVALLNEKSTFPIGQSLDSNINKLIVEKNFSKAALNNGKNLYDRLQFKSSPGTYKVRKIKNGYCFDLVAANGEFLATSEIYSSLDSCANGIMSVKRNAYSSVEDQTENNYQSIRNPKYELYCDKLGVFRFRLKSMNGQIIMVSQGYKSKKMCLDIIEKIKLSVDTDDIEKN